MGDAFGHLGPELQIAHLLGVREVEDLDCRIEQHHQIRLEYRDGHELLVQDVHCVLLFDLPVLPDEDAHVACRQNQDLVEVSPLDQRERTDIDWQVRYLELLILQVDHLVALFLNPQVEVRSQVGCADRHFWQ